MTSNEPLAARLAWLNALATAMANTNTTAASATADDTEDNQ